MRAFHRGYLANWPISYAMRQIPRTRQQQPPGGLSELCSRHIFLGISVCRYWPSLSEIPSQLKARELADDSPSISVLSKLLAQFSAHVDNSAKHGAWATGTSPQRLLPLERVFDAADRILELSCRLIGVAFRLQLGITKHLAGALLGFTFNLLRRSLDPVLVRDLFLQDQASPLTEEVALATLSFSFGIRT